MDASYHLPQRPVKTPHAFFPPGAARPEAGERRAAWDLRPGSSPGFTCCQLADLSNPVSLADERIDVVFSGRVPALVRAHTLGSGPEDRTVPERLWPSDHAAVVATLGFD